MDSWFTCWGWFCWLVLLVYQRVPPLTSLVLKRPQKKAQSMSEPCVIDRQNAWSPSTGGWTKTHEIKSIHPRCGKWTKERGAGSGSLKTPCNAILNPISHCTVGFQDIFHHAGLKQYHEPNGINHHTGNIFPINPWIGRYYISYSQFCRK